MNATETIAPDIDSLVAEVADRFTDEVKQGRAPSVEDYAQRHPEIATIVRQVFPALAVLGNIDANSGLSTNTQADDTAVGQSVGLLGDFRILRELGRGGMGVVYEAEQISLGRRVALKVLPFAAMLDRQQLARFKNEARAAATLDHPNIVAIYSVGVERSVHFYAMQLIEGQSLAQVIDQLRGKNDARSSMLDAGSRQESGIKHPASSIQQPASDTEPVARLDTLPDFNSKEYYHSVAMLGIQAAEALDHAHQNGILHRDIKPANLLLECQTPSPLRGGLGRGCDDPAHLKLWITDFGLARMEQDAGMTMTGDILGTLRYMSPEQALAKRVVVDHRSDIYSLGVTLYELLTLQPAFTGDDRQELLRQIAFEEPRKLRQINVRIPSDLETIVLKAIEKNPADRFASAGDLADDLRHFFHHEPINAKPPTWRNGAVKWTKRHPALIWAASLILVAVAIASSGSAILINSAYEREAVQRKKSDENARRANAVSEFLRDVIVGASPNHDGRNTTLAQLLGNAIDKIQDKFHDDPHTKATLLAAIGWSCLDLDLVAEAIKAFEQADHLYKEKLGPNHSATLAQKIALGTAYSKLGDVGKAVATLEETLKLCVTHLGDEHQHTLAAKNQLAGTYLMAGRSLDALRLIETNFAYLKRTKGPTHHETIVALGNLASIYQKFGRLDEALPMLEEHLTLQKASQGDKHPDTIRAMDKLAGIYVELERFDEAVALQQQAVQLSNERMGSTHSATLGTMSSLAHALKGAGRQTEAIDLYREVISLSESTRGPEHPDTVRAKFNLAVIFLESNDLDAALPMLVDVTEAAKKTFGLQHPETLYVGTCLVLAYNGAARYDEAAKLLRDISRIDEQRFTSTTIELETMNLIAWILATSSIDSERDGKRAVELATRVCKLTKSKVPGSLDTKAAAYAEIGDFDTAIEVSEQAIQIVNDNALRAELLKNLDSYRAKKPIREVLNHRSLID